MAAAGTFDVWQTILMVKSERDFVATVDLLEGLYGYKFLVDCEWKVSQKEVACTGSNNIHPG